MDITHRPTLRGRALTLVLIGPTTVASGTLLLRVLLHRGVWEAFHAFGVALFLAAVVGIATSTIVARRAREGRRALGFVASLAGQVVLAIALLNAVWWLVPLGVSGP